MGFYLAIKKNEIMSFAGKLLKVEMIMLREISHTHKDKYHMFSLIYGNLDETTTIKKNQDHESKKGTTREMEWGKGKGVRKSNGGGEYVNMTKVHYMHVWKCHEDTP
jgi:hypothetical protein